MVSPTQRPFQRARFDALEKQTAKIDNIKSLLDLIRFNAENNPDHIFCVQALWDASGGDANSSLSGYSSYRISFKELRDAVETCSSWIENDMDIFNKSSGHDTKVAPAALYMESDVSLFLYIVALLALNVPVVLLSARLSTESVRHLLSETGACSILLSPKTERLIANEITDLAVAKVVPPFSFFHHQTMGSDSNGRLHHTTDPACIDEDAGGLILHSSGTTGLPKPILLSQRYLLGYAACHSFPTDEDASWPNLSTMPLYHGFGILAPCLSLSVGMTCILPPPNTIPAAHSTIELLSLFKAESLMTVPSILEDIISATDNQRDSSISVMQQLRFVAVGGGPMSSDVRETLIAEHVKVLNHYGATEIGAIAPIFQPGDDYDARYLRLRNDLDLQLRQLESDQQQQRFKLVGFPFGWGGRPFEIQDELIKRPASAHIEVQILGRTDDLIVLKNGEKVVPRLLETAMTQDPNIKTAVCLGEGEFEVAVLVEPSRPLEDLEAFLEHVWQLLCDTINPSLDAHARISSRQAVIVKAPQKTIPRSDKGSVMRKEVYKIFDQEIREAYTALQLGGSSKGDMIDFSRVEDSISRIIQSLMDGNLADWQRDEDLFEIGMDSLQATRLVRLLGASMSQASLGDPKVIRRLSPAFIYKNPSLSKLVTAVHELIDNKGSESLIEVSERASRMQELVEEYSNTLECFEDSSIEENVPKNIVGAVVLLTGSTGNLGAHVLSCLAHSRRVSKIVCLNRHISGEGRGDSMRDRQERANSIAGVPLSSIAWEKVSFIASHMQAPNLGLSRHQLAQLACCVTHIVHLAWPMDFKRQLESFRPHFDGLQTIIRLARSIGRVRPNERSPRVLLSSSISVVRHHHERTGLRVVPERELQDPLVTADMGYAEAKWVCERVLHNMATQDDRYKPLIVRIGQLSGPERTAGIWKTEEHVPALIKASQVMSAFPNLEGEFSWLPVDCAARSLVDILLNDNDTKTTYYHLENPIRQPWTMFAALMNRELALKDGCIPFDAWLDRMTASETAKSLVEFFKNDFRALASGNVVLDTSNTRNASIHLRGSHGVSQELMTEYIQRWNDIGYLV
ncbi:hypothetical protein ACN47E_004489 [Coniothyrium glycines]